MKYTTEIVKDLIAVYTAAPNLNTVSLLAKKYDTTDRSIIAKLSSLGCYKRKEYVNKRGEHPIKKEELIENIAKLLDMNVELMESMEKCTKYVLTELERRIRTLTEQSSG